MESLDDVAKAIKARREALGISQKKLAMLLHLSQSTIARLERDIDRLNPSYGIVFKVITTLDSLSAIDTKGRLMHKTAAEIMHSKIICASPEDTVAKAIRMVREYDFPQLPVLDKGRNIVGAVSQKRLMGIATQNPEDINRTKVGDIMDIEVPRVGKDTDVARIRKLLEDWNAVLVVEKGKAIGIITIYDVLKEL
jgi:predicted transcriptional regulator